MSAFRKKRPLGITVIGWGLISWMSASLIQPFLHPDKLVDNLFNIYYPPLQLVWLISSGILIGFIIGAFQVLQLKEMGRSLIIFLVIIDIPHLIVGKAIYNNYNLRPIYLRNSFMIIISVIINLTILHYFYYPKVKEQFH